MKRKTREEKAITLIALIITIVVLLILAVVAINAVTGDGIIQHAVNAKENYEKAQDNESAQLQEYFKYLNTNNPTHIAKRTEDGVPIPVGFEYVTGTKDSGVVIKKQKEGSQFVWIPVTKDMIAEEGREPAIITTEFNSATQQWVDGADKDIDNLQIAGCTDLDGDNDIDENDFKIQLTNEFNLMASSIKKYGGYYVGRYELSLNSNGLAQSKSGVSSATAEADSANTWYGLYSVCKTYNTESVKSSMLWGSQYEFMLEWMGDITNSPIEGYNTTKITGGVGTDVIKNVYDIGGCHIEAMLEVVDSNYRRGGPGCWFYNGIPSDREGNYPTANDEWYGSRLALYIL